MEKEIIIILRGLVQGVGMRVRVNEIAKRNNIKGYVKNIKDGGVYICAQAIQLKLNNFISEIFNLGLPANIKKVEIDYVKTSNKYEDFKILKEKNFIEDQISSYKNFTKEIFNKLSKTNMPKHVAIIPDGNRRWARAKGLESFVGHQEASKMDKIIEMFTSCKDLKIKYLTLWILSTENWQKRPKYEVDILYKIMIDAEKPWIKFMNEQNIKLIHIGRKDRLPKNVIQAVNNIEDATKNNKDMIFQLGMDYGGKDEIVRAVNKIIKSGEKEINEEKFAKHLDTNKVPDPDLIIRTGGEKRTSGFMPYQSEYAEYYFTDTLFPDFDTQEFKQAIYEFSNRIRRFGGDNSKDKK